MKFPRIAALAFVAVCVSATIAQSAVKISATALSVARSSTDACGFTVKASGVTPNESYYVHTYYYDTIGNSVLVSPGVPLTIDFASVSADSRGTYSYSGTINRSNMMSLYPDMANVVFEVLRASDNRQAAPGVLKSNRCY